MQDDTTLETLNLCRHFGKVRAINGLTLKINSGERVVLIGPNGSGKTTLIKLLSTLIRPTSGTLKLFGHDVASKGAWIRGRVGVLLHEPLLYARLTALENLNFFSKMFQVPCFGPKIIQLADELAVKNLLPKKVGDLSHGQRKRISILRTLLHDPDLLLLDEPDSGLDEESLERLIEVMSGNGRTLIMSTHNLNNGLRMANRVILLDDGRIIMDRDQSAINQSELDRKYATLLAR